LRAPLTVVRTHVELLGRHADGSEEMRSAVSDIHMAVRALQHLIVQLISLAKAERPGGHDDAIGSFDLVECAAATARSYATSALEKNMDMSFDAMCEKLPVSGNAIFAGEMIANLLDNAIRYGAPGGRISLRICAEQRRLEIEDDGPGIPVKDRERVFERFYRMPHNLNSEGSGLGLSIVLALGSRMGASVHLETPANGNGLLVIMQFQKASGAVMPSFDLTARLTPSSHKFGADQTV
jgi:two-component system sensor histidine kinase TctE